MHKESTPSGTPTDEAEAKKKPKAKATAKAAEGTTDGAKMSAYQLDRIYLALCFFACK